MAPGKEGSLTEPRVLAVSNTWPPMSAGSGRAFAELVAGIPGVVALVPVSSASSADPPWVRRTLRFSGRSGGPFKLHTVLQHLEVVLAPLRYTLRAGPPACVFTSQPLFSGVGAWLLQRARRVPYLVMVHGEELTGCAVERTPMQPRRRLLRLTLRDAAAVVCNAEHTRDLAVRIGGVPPHRVHVVPPGVNVAELMRAESSVTPRRGMLLMVGRLWQSHKGFDRAIEAMPLVAREHPEASLMIAGPGDPTPLELIASRCGVRDRVTFTGELPREALLRLFAECSVFVLPGRSVEGTAEGFGLVYLEAAAFGKPAIAGRAGGASEAVLDERTGLVVDGDDPAAIAAAVTRLLADPALAERLGAAARSRVLREFDARARHAALAAIVADVARSTSERARRR